MISTWTVICNYKPYSPQPLSAHSIRTVQCGSTLDTSCCRAVTHSVFFLFLGNVNQSLLWSFMMMHPCQLPQFCPWISYLGACSGCGSVWHEVHANLHGDFAGIFELQLHLNQLPLQGHLQNQQTHEPHVLLQNLVHASTRSHAMLGLYATFQMWDDEWLNWLNV